MSSYGIGGYRGPVDPRDLPPAPGLPQNRPTRRAACTPPSRRQIAAARVAMAWMEEQERKEKERRELLGLRF